MPRRLLVLLLGATATAFVAPRARLRPRIALQADTSARVVDAVEELNGVVTAGDVAARGAAPLVSAERELLALAARLGEEATLDVREDGALTFKFPPKTKRALAAVDGKERWLQRWESTKPTLYTLGRTAFGLSLFASLAVGAALLATLSAANEGEQRRERRSSNVYWGPSIWGPSPFDIFYYRSYYDRPRSNEEMNFLEAVYSYVFGDGDPNADVDKKQIAAAADAIRKSGGAVVAEQLAPYLALPPSENADDVIEEGYVLPVVAALDGRATVDDETGSIVYVFDDLVRGAKASSSSDGGALAEEDIQFSNASQGQLAAAGVLGVANLGVAAAAVFYSTVGVTPTVLASLGPGGLAALRAVAGPLFAYAVAFNALPAARAGRAERAAKAVEERNLRRQTLRARLERPSRRLREKLAAARRLAPRILGGGGGASVYSTADDAQKLERARVADDLAAFDDALRARDDAE